MAKTSLSVILTVYNMEECLEAFLNSLVAQSWHDYEVLCINDGSTDKSAEILERYSGKLPRFQLINQQNRGVSASRNLGISKACGEYLMILDSDDILDPSLLQSMMEATGQANADVVVCRSDEFHHRTGIWHKTPWAARADLLPNRKAFSAEQASGNLFRAFAGWPWDKLYRTEFIREHNLFFPDLRNSEDLCFVYPALASAGTIAFVNKTLIHHRTNRSGSVSSSHVSGPRDFYKAVVFLKQYLKSKVDYAKFERGFLNWAMDFTLWNIESLPEGDDRSSLVSDLLEGKLIELEIDSHPEEYFSLYPRTAKRLSNLKKERLGGQISTRRSVGNIVSTLWNYVATLDLGATMTHALKTRRHNG